MIAIQTHEKIDRRLCGVPLETRQGYSRVALATTDEMAVDGKGLVHGGFVFGLADHAAMIAVNEPAVVLASSTVKFLKPLRAGESIVAEATAQEKGGRKHLVSVTVKRGNDIVFVGEFICLVLDRHVLELPANG